MSGAPAPGALGLEREGRRMERVYRAPKITCEGCVETITRALSGVPGVQATQVTIPSEEVRVEFDAARLEDRRVRQTLAEAGFSPV